MTKIAEGRLSMIVTLETNKNIDNLNNEIYDLTIDQVTEFTIKMVDGRYIKLNAYFPNIQWIAH